MTTRPRPTRPSPIDRDALRARLAETTAEAGTDAALRRTLTRPALAEALAAGRAAARARLEAGGGGVEVARTLSAAADSLVGALWDFSNEDVFRLANPTKGERAALLAVGGYGRGVLAPYSDLDLLFLRPGKSTPHGESVTEFMLYALWDLGLKVGWASRTVEESLRIAREDSTVSTALLEARPLAGDPDLAAEFARKYVKQVHRGDARAFVAAKLQERDVRHAKAGASRYLVEPNVKEGKGGLRDLNTLFWIARWLDPANPYGEDALRGVLTARDWRTMEEAFDFLWKTRHWLHFTAGRAEERLTFDRQPEIAARMGYSGRGDAPAVERFMRRYFLVAKEVGALTRTFCAMLEHAQQKAPQPLSRILPRRARRRKLDVEAFVEEGGRLALATPDVFETDPANLLRLFRTADRFDLDLHPDAFAAVSRSLGLVTPKLRRDPEAARVFLSILANGSQPYRVLSLMNDAGLLGRFLPEFARVVGQTQFNMYHAYTVDEHTLRAIGVIKDIEQGRFADDHPLSTEIMPLIGEREALYLAMLLHDTGKGGTRGQLEDGAIAARRACDRLGLDRSQGELVSWLVRRHLLLSDFAQKRDVGDPDTVAAFARIVETPERLRLLLVLTVADVRAVGPGVWNGWKGQMMRELYAAAEALFRGGRSSDLSARAKERQSALAAAARARLVEARPSAQAWAEAMEDAYFVAVDPDESVSHFELSETIGASGAASAARMDADRNATELVLAARDRLGLFADVAQALAHVGADVVGAQVFTSRDGLALDLFHLQDGAGRPYGADAPGDLIRLRSAIDRAAKGSPPGRPPGPFAPTGRAAAFEIKPAVAVDNEATAAATVVEASGRDRPGLLADLSRTLADARLSIQSAHVQSYGERAVDAFYVLDESGEKLLDPERIAALRSALGAALGSDERATAGGRARSAPAR